ncbi:unnamed protein product [Enterobius vermicularis]|uniref:Vegetative cell wall protein gp1-like n=1 Tax=Enterobius vermicularis TaxID=51028 RepID=A0A0N4V0L7_ENTVE|nr:unnamed protein product [Enterobius vermicularis]
MIQVSDQNLIQNGTVSVPQLFNQPSLFPQFPLPVSPPNIGFPLFPTSPQAVALASNPPVLPMPMPGLMPASFSAAAPSVLPTIPQQTMQPLSSASQMTVPAAVSQVPLQTATAPAPQPLPTVPISPVPAQFPSQSPLPVSPLVSPELLQTSPLLPPLTAAQPALSGIPQPILPPLPLPVQQLLPLPAVAPVSPVASLAPPLLPFLPPVDFFYCSAHASFALTASFGTESKSSRTYVPVNLSTIPPVAASRDKDPEVGMGRPFVADRPTVTNPLSETRQLCRYAASNSILSCQACCKVAAHYSPLTPVR